MEYVTDMGHGCTCHLGQGTLTCDGHGTGTGIDRHGTQDQPGTDIGHVRHGACETRGMERDVIRIYTHKHI